jgi:hypothetical protein
LSFLQFEKFRDNDQIVEQLLYRVKNLGTCLEQNQNGFNPDMPCLALVKKTLEETYQSLCNFKKQGFVLRFFLARDFQKEFLRLNRLLTQSFADLQFVIIAQFQSNKSVPPAPPVSAESVANEIIQKMVNTLPEYLCSNVEHIKELVDMPSDTQHQLIDLMLTKQSLEREQVLNTLQQLKAAKQMDERQFLQTAPMVLSAAFALKAGPPMSVDCVRIESEHRLGEGTFGNVYKGSMRSIDTPVAVKYISVQSKNDKKMFERELGSLKRLCDCPNVIKYHGWLDNAREPGSSKTAVALVLEYCPRSLNELVLDFNYFPPLQTWINCLRQIACGMRYLSQMGVIHRDLKPDNILITSKNEIAISDFGLSITKTSIHRMSVSEKLATAGTMGYMAPETLLEGKVSEFSDVYAFGVIASYVLHRAEPWIDNRGNPLTGLHLQKAIETRLPRTINKIAFPDCSSQFMELIPSCCSKEISSRPRFIELEMILSNSMSHGPFGRPTKAANTTTSAANKPQFLSFENFIDSKPKVVASHKCDEYYYRDKGNRSEATFYTNGRIRKDVRGPTEILHFNNGDIYEGELNNGELHGFGILRSATGNVYEGKWINGNRTGMGVLRLADGGCYKGQFVDGSMEGTGNYRWTDGRFYKGRWKDNQFNGIGFLRFVNGDFYEGEFENCQFTGRGVFRHITGNVYDGNWEYGKRNGMGTLWFADGAIYEGNFKNDNREGMGSCRYLNGNVYEGEWSNDFWNGQGILRYAEGDVYEGEFKNHNRDGAGTYRFTNGNIYIGEWVNGIRNGKGKMIFAEGDVFEGDFLNDKMHGMGTYRYISGNVYEGEWMNEVRNGKGVFRFVNGDVYEGDFMNDKMQGTAKFRWKDGRVYEGKFTDDVMRRILAADK